MKVQFYCEHLCTTVGISSQCAKMRERSLIGVRYFPFECHVETTMTNLLAKSR